MNFNLRDGKLHNYIAFDHTDNVAFGPKLSNATAADREARITEMLDLIRSADEETLTEAFSDSAEGYNRWLAARRKNKWRENEQQEAIQRPNLLGPLFGNALRLGRKPTDDQSTKK